jgi:hypothetical protein
VHKISAAETFIAQDNIIFEPINQPEFTAVISENIQIMNRIYTLFTVAFGLLCVPFIANSQVIAEYNFTVNADVVTADPNITAGTLTKTPAGTIQFSGTNGAFIGNWPLAAALDENFYYEILISPDPGYDMNISNILFNNRRSGTGPTEYALYWSKDGVFANSTLLDSGNLPNNNTNYVRDVTGLNIDVLDGETLYLRWYAWNASASGGTYWMAHQAGVSLEIEGTVIPQITAVSLNNAEQVVNENDGTYDVVVNIDAEDVNPTQVDLVLVSGNSAAVNGFTSQTVIFPSGSGASETVTLTLTDDGICSADETLVFELQNVSGGNSAIIGSPSTLTLSIEDDEKTLNTAYDNDFEANNLNEWMQGSPGHWATSTTSPIAGTYSFKHNLTGVSGSSYASVSMGDLSLDGLETTWRFQAKNGTWQMSTNNRFWVFLGSSSSTLFPNSSTTGYAVGVNMTGSTRLLTLFRLDAGGSVTPIIESDFDWDTGYTLGIEVVRDENGNWKLSYDADGGFDNLVPSSPVSDNTYNVSEHIGVVFQYTTSRSGELWIDDLSVTQTACAYTYYSQASGDYEGAIWDTQLVGTGAAAQINRYNNFVIQNGHTVSLSGNVEAKNLTIDAGGSLDLGSGGNKILVSGNWSNSGTFTAGDGKVQFAGISNVSVSGVNAFFDLQSDLLNSDLNLNDDTDLWGTLLLNNGTLNTNGNVFTVRSDAANTGAIGPIGASASVNGDVTVERFIQDGPTGWRNLGASVSGATLADWNEHFTTTGFPGSDFPDWPSPANRFVSLKSYNETLLGDREIGWTMPTSLTNVIGDFQGFWMYLGGSELPNTVDVTGSLITGEQFLALDYTEDLGPFHDGWNLISNPYVATIDWDHPDFTKVDVENAIWIWNSDVQQYGNYIGSISLHGVTNEIAHSQSFWVRGADIASSLTFRESIKIDNNNADWIKSNDAPEGIVRLRIDGNNYYDETVLVFNEDATLGYEGSFDAMKFYSPNDQVPGMATLAQYGEEPVDLSINAFNIPETGSISIPLRTVAGVAGNYVLSVHETENIPAGACLYIEDLETSEVMLVEVGQQMNITLDTAQSAPRFVIHLSAPFALSKQDNSCFGAEDGFATALGEGDGPFTYVWTNELNEVIQTTENVLVADTLHNVPAGLYHVSVSADSDICGTRTNEIIVEEPLPLSVFHTSEAPECNTGSNGVLQVMADGGQDNWNFVLSGPNGFESVSGENDGVFSFTSLESGNYVLQAENSCGTLEEVISLSDPNAVTADFELSAEIISLADGGTVTITNNSVNAIQYSWSMGDGTSYYTEDVVHTYTQPGVYEVLLYAVGNGCEEEIIKTLEVTDITSGINEVTNESGIDIWFDGNEIVIAHDFSGEEMDIRVMNILGKTLISAQTFNERTTLSLNDSEFVPGVYLINVSVNNEVSTQKIVLGN